jgi:hypothetical protein
VGFDDDATAAPDPPAFAALPLAFAIARDAARRSAWFIASSRPLPLVEP